MDGEVELGPTVRLMQGQLPLVDVMLPVGIPNTVQAGGQGDGPFDFAALRDERNVGVAHLDGQKSLAFHLGEKTSKSGHSRVRKVPQHVVGDAVRSRCFVWKAPEELLQKG